LICYKHTIKKLSKLVILKILEYNVTENI